MRCRSPCQRLGLGVQVLIVQLLVSLDVSLFVCLAPLLLQLRQLLAELALGLLRGLGLEVLLYTRHAVMQVGDVGLLLGQFVLQGLPLAHLAGDALLYLLAVLFLVVLMGRFGIGLGFRFRRFRLFWR